MIPSSMLEELALETGVNKYSKKLQGEIIFKLLIYCIVSNKDNSLRGMESAYESLCFNVLQIDASKNTISYSSISERLKTINYEYFEKLFYRCVELYGDIVGEDQAKIVRFDSTIVTTSGKLLKYGYSLKGASEYLKQLKYTIGFSHIPTSVDVYTEAQVVGENAALRALILKHQPSNENAIRVFDMGLSSRNIFEEFTLKKIPFITRLRQDNNMEVVSENLIDGPIKTNSLMIYSDHWGYLFKRNGKTKILFRLIKAVRLEDDEPIWFVTNIPELNAEEISSLYRKRWDIENLFKFFKQELNLSHLLNRSENGIKVVLYATLIASILVIVYKKTNKLKGYKIMKQRFVQDMEKLVAIDLVFLCDGNPEKAKQILFNSS